MSSPPSWMLWMAVIVMAIYVLDFVFKVILYVVTFVVVALQDRKRTNYISKRDRY
jgi:hypothetical protein